jgi:hypothetical protein
VPSGSSFTSFPRPDFDFEVAGGDGVGVSNQQLQIGNTRITLLVYGRQENDRKLEAKLCQ